MLALLPPLPPPPPLRLYSAVEWAKESNYVETTSVLLQFKQGNQGLVLGERGAAVEKVPCCWGCGLITDRNTLVQHESTDCPKRAVFCRNDACHVELQACRSA